MSAAAGAAAVFANGEVSLDCGNDFFGSETEFFSKSLVGGTCTEMVKTDGKTFVTDYLCPAESGSGFDANALFDGGGQNAVAVFLVLSKKVLHGNHGNQEQD